MSRFTIILIVLLAAVAGGVIAFRQIIVMDMPGESYRGELAPLSPAQTALTKRLEVDVQALAGEIGERNLFRNGTLERAALYIEKSFEAAGQRVESQEFLVRGKTVRNVEAVIPGRNSASGIIVVGAHYDSVRGSPGANDNASGVAALLALGRALRAGSFARSIHLVAFVNEEQPFARTNAMGSVQYVERLINQGKKVAAMLSLETIGYYTDEPGSQRYPFPLNYFYPETGNFIGFVGNPPSKALVFKMVTTFRENARFPSEGLAAPGRIKGVDWSDHWTFWQRGLPAVMVTDTALYRYHEYHTVKDTPRILAYGRLARVVEGLVAVVINLADGDETESR